MYTILAFVFDVVAYSSPPFVSCRAFIFLAGVGWDVKWRPGWCDWKQDKQYCLASNSECDLTGSILSPGVSGLNEPSCDNLLQSAKPHFGQSGDTSMKTH